MQTWLIQQQLAAALEQLTIHLRALSPQAVAAVQTLSVEQLAELQAALADWTDESDFAAWFQAQAETDDNLL